jgi:hypothetical protein
MVISRYNRISKANAPIPITEMTNAEADHHKNKMQFVPVEQAIMYQILEELKEIKEYLKKRI